jgi:Flp pilus assembly protein TadB
MRGFARLVFLFVLLIAAPVARNYWGSLGERIVIGGVLILFAIAALVDWRREREIRRTVATLPLDEQIAAIQADAEVRDAAAGDVFGNERPDRTWQFTRAAGPVLGMLYLPALYRVVADRRANGLVAMGLAVVGVFLWRWWARRYVTRYHCPRCGARIPAVSLRPVRYVCGPCAITWRL